MNTAFDTLTALRDLEASGLDSRHAEAIVQVLSQSHEQVATKGDISGLQNELSTFQEGTRSEFAALRNDMDDGFAAVRKEWKEEFAAFRKEVENRFAIQDVNFQVALSSTANKILVAQVAVGGLVIAVLRLL